MNYKKITKQFPKMLLVLFVLQSSNSLMAQNTDSIPAGVYSWNKLHPKKEKSSISRQILKGQTLDLAYFEMHASTLDPGEAPHPAHTHVDTEEVIIVKEGTVKLTINGVTNLLGPSSIAVVMPSDKHGIENAGNTEATYYIMKLKSRFPTNNERTKKAGNSFAINWDTVTVRHTGKGKHRDIFDRPTSQFARFDVHATTLNAGQVSHAPHTHRAEEMILMIKGNVQMQIGNNFYKASAGDIIFLTSGILHALNNTGSNACEYFALQWQN